MLEVRVTVPPVIAVAGLGDVVMIGFWAKVIPANKSAKVIFFMCY
jgi:xanthosine utilization system XapX-like protein